MSSPPPPPPTPPPFFPFSPNTTPSSGPSFPIILIAIIGILATGFLLVTYYVFVIKCCLNNNSSNRRLRLFSTRLHSTTTTTIYPSPPAVPRGLDPHLIQSIPIIKFRKEVRSSGGNIDTPDDQAHYECAVCLSEFKDGEKLRVIPNCCHAFHIDCIDVWLQSSANCPLCRSTISSDTFLAIAPRESAPHLSNHDDNHDYVVIELRDNNVDDGRDLVPIDFSKTGQWSNKKGRVMSMGDEFIEMRRLGEDDDDGLRVQPIRRSISMDSSRDREIYLRVQDILHKKQRDEEGNASDHDHQGCSSRSVKRLLFSFSSNGR